jgi:lauroyl/myristoyl acyltransferase
LFGPRARTVKDGVRFRSTIRTLLRKTRRRTLAAVAEASLSDLVARALGQTIEDDDPRLSAALSWARNVRGSAATEEEIHELARRRVTADEITRAAGWRPRDAFELEIEGEGLELLATPGQPVIFAFAHTVGVPALGFALTTRMQRPLYLQTKRDRSKLPTEPRVADLVEVIGEAFGLRPFQTENTVRTAVHLLDSGGALALPVDQPGSGAGSLFGNSVRTLDAAARLASLTEAPVVLGVSRLRDGRLEARTPAPLYRRDFGSPAELHRAILESLEDAVNGDPGQLLTDPFPLAEVARARKDYRRTARARDAARREVELTRAQLDILVERVNNAKRALRAAGSDRDRAAARALANRAAADLEAAQAELSAARDQRDRLKLKVADITPLAKSGLPTGER